ncbi:MAG TPA: VOC family protein [Pseudonocardiaceae bacterium]|nr:VOC family protein [Pseudonocardiaceae bacterium]
MAAVLNEIIIDCEDPRRVAEFWGQVLGWQVQEHEGALWMTESGDWRDFGLVFLRVPEGKSVKNRLHLDVSPVGCDRDEEVARLRGLGARPVDIGQGDVPWVVMADPEGNEFCVLGRRADA